jgi:hypothetical protein
MGAPFGSQQPFVYNQQAGPPLQQAYMQPNAPPVIYTYLHFYGFFLFM